jgi:hypothetical protein
MKKSQIAEPVVTVGWKFSNGATLEAPFSLRFSALPADQTYF